MRSLFAVVAALTLILFGQSFPRAAFSHSLEAVETELRSKEPNVEFIDQTDASLPLPFFLEENVRQAVIDRKISILNIADKDCQADCAGHMTLISKLQKMVNSAHMIDQVRFITLITSTEMIERDNVLTSSFIERFGLNPINWKGLPINGQAPGTTNRLVDLLDVMKVSPDVQTEQDRVTYVIDREGQLRAQFNGLEFQPVNLVSLANTLVYDTHDITTEEISTNHSSVPLNLNIPDVLVSGSVIVSGLTFGFFWYRRHRKSHQ
ncbi:hypothetical protein [Saccharospirillum alexandrii]|uniref:hypothetical protein n=1 Tax=Saccharospirillum alexandrii TaxID=2448477 RepID=UPI000FD944F9|nr:hypothetical protein [Saccharospirillum alexandrii]